MVHNTIQTFSPHRVTIIVRTVFQLVGRQYRQLFIMLTNNLRFNIVIITRHFRIPVAPTKLINSGSGPTHVTSRRHITTLTPFTFRFKRFRFSRRHTGRLTIITHSNTKRRVAKSTTNRTRHMGTPTTLDTNLTRMKTGAMIITSMATKRPPVTHNSNRTHIIRRFRNQKLNNTISFFRFTIRRILLLKTR